MNLDAVMRATDRGVLLRVKVVPGSSRDRLAGVLGDRLKVTVSAPAEGGRANAAVCGMLARALGVSAKSVTIVEGHTQPRKTVLITGMTPAQVIVAIGTGTARR